MTPLENWGKDHWSLFAYVETRVTDYKGTLDHNHLRPREYPTRLKDGEEVQDQGDLDLLRDLEDLGLTKNEGSGLNPSSPSRRRDGNGRSPFVSTSQTGTTSGTSSHHYEPLPPHHHYGK